MEQKEAVRKMRTEARQELRDNILEFWSQKMPDEIKGGFHGSIGFDHNTVPGAPRGGILNTRILWTFSMAEQFFGDGKYLPYAEKAWHYLENHFRDREFGGIYWKLDPYGKVLDYRKQFYLLAFGIYSLSEYYQLTQNSRALDWAKELFRLIEQKSRDKLAGGYVEACTREWKSIGDMRLSEKDLNAPKTMNTHLHILEAYTSLLRIWPDSELKDALKDLTLLFIEKFVAGGKTLTLFFDVNWNPLGNTTSFGHDIEFSWLLTESAKLLGDPVLLRECEEVAVRIAGEVAEKGMDTDGGLMYEYYPYKKEYHSDKHWWPQAEALVGFINAWEISGDDRFLEHSLKSWEFIKNYVIDREKGEWHNELSRDRKIIPGLEKAGFWKCPYHNSRAMAEIWRRLEKF